jgi:hypothetical protein
MQKIKKSLQNNILKINVQQQQIALSIESSSNAFISTNISKALISKTLTACSLKQISFLKLLEVSKLKFPLVLNLFQNKTVLKEYLNSLINNKRQQQILLVKVDNNIFKDNTYEIVENYSSSNVFFQIKNFTNHTLNLIKVLKLIAKK